MSLSRKCSEVSPQRGTVVLSLDAEQIWGHLDLLDQHLYSERYPNTPATYEHLLRMICSAGMSATWLVVGGLCLRGSEGPGDFRLRGLPPRWSGHVPAGNEMTRPLWYRRSFIQQLTKAHPAQDVGLHGGLTHLIWTDRDGTPDAVGAELKAGLAALNELGIRPRSFSFPRNRERYHALLAEHAFSCYRGAGSSLSAKFGRSLPGSVARLLEEVGRFTPPPVWPVETLPGLWNIPASLFLYPISDSRSRFVPLATRRERVRRGVEMAVRCRAIFHFCLHPANLAESVRGFPLFEEILEQLIRARELGDVEILTMTEVAERMAAQTLTSPAAEQLNAHAAARLSLARMGTAESSFLRNAGD
jgi:hypothetical protein